MANENVVYFVLLVCKKIIGKKEKEQLKIFLNINLWFANLFVLMKGIYEDNCKRMHTVK